MRFALFGIDDESWRLVRAVCNSELHHLAAVCNAGVAGEQLRSLAPEAHWHDHWEALLAEDVADAVIAAGPSEPGAHDDPLRKLANKGMPLVLVHPAAEPLLCYELDMIQRDTGGVLFPFIPDRLHPAIVQLEDWSRDSGASPIGAVEQVVLERSMQQSSRDDVLRQVARDVELIAAVAGKIRRVSAIGPSFGGDDFSNLSVQMSCDGGTVGRWSACASSDDLPSTLRITGSLGKATLNMPADAPWQMEMPNGSVESFPNYDDGRAALAAFFRALDGHPPQPDWPQACRDVEIMDSIPRSLKRGRTIDILDEQHSEEQSFKGIMAAGGCGILLCVLVVILVLALVDGLTMPHRDADLNPITASEAERHPIAADTRNPDRPHVLIRIWPVYPIGLFLLLQFLRLIAKRHSTVESARAGSESSAQAS